MHRAVELGFKVLKPYGDSAAYDFAVDHGRGFVRVQVKSIRKRLRAGIYQIQTKHGGEQRAYRRGEVDVVAAQLVDEDTWYLIPERVFTGRTAVYVGGKRGKNEEYREAWDLLRARENGRGGRRGR